MKHTNVTRCATATHNSRTIAERSTINSSSFYTIRLVETVQTFSSNQWYFYTSHKLQNHRHRNRWCVPLSANTLSRYYYMRNTKIRGDDIVIATIVTSCPSKRVKCGPTDPLGFGSVTPGRYDDFARDKYCVILIYYHFPSPETRDQKKRRDFRENSTHRI